MISIIETLNQFGGQFLNFAWPMLWQSSLLIVILFALDFFFRRKIRASIRYALWLVVLIKLILPPALASPTNPVWWLHKNPTTISVEPKYKNFTVTYDSQPLSEIPKNFVPVVPPKPKLIFAAWLLTISISVSVILFAWLLIRWWQIAREVRRAKIFERLIFLANGARLFCENSPSSRPSPPAGEKVAGGRLRGNPRAMTPVKLTDNKMSPAVCGLFRPTILIPQTLAKNFSDKQLRAVLLHELFHLRRGDVWVNFFQSLLQIFYWWHPLLWFANARIRRAREEAVDDAVMLALRDDAESYAPTLLEVAKLALNRPLASLGLVGILESRSALRQRIERLLNFSAPRKAGLTFLSLCEIFIFSAVALPMGEGPDSINEKDLPATSTTTISSTPTNASVVLIQAEIYQMRQTDLEKLLSDPAYVASKNDQDERFRQVSRLLKSSGFNLIQRPRIQTASGMPAQFYIGDKTNSVEFDCHPIVTNGLIHLASQITIISTRENRTTTNQMTSYDTFKNGSGRISSIVRNNGSISNVVVVMMSAEIVTNSLKKISQNEIPELYSRQFKVDKVVFSTGLQKQTDFQIENAADISRALKNYLSKFDVDMDASDKSIFYDDSSDVVVVKATKSDLDTIGGVITKLEIGVEPQIHIKARFVEIEQDDKSGFNLNLGQISNNSETSSSGNNPNFPGIITTTSANASSAIGDTNSQLQVAGLTGILTEKNYRTVWQALKSRPKTKILAEPEVVTTSGRQTRMRATTVVSVVTNMIVETNPTNHQSSIVPQTAQIETGPILDAVANVLADGYAIDLKTTPSLTEFLGYDQPPTNALTKHDEETGIDVPVILPKFDVQESVSHVKLYDGQTLVFGGLISRTNNVIDKVPVLGNLPKVGQFFQSQSKQVVNNQLLVFVTVDLVDPAGNRIYSDEKMPFAQNGIPPQN